MSFDLDAVRRQFPILSETVHGRPLHYLDNAATGQIPEPVLDAVVRQETRCRANVLRGNHTLATQATEAFEAARAEVAAHINAASPAEVVFTSGATSALNLAARSFGERLAAGDEVVLSDLEHHSNFVPWQMLRDRRGVVLKGLPTTPEGRIDLGALERVVTPRCRLIAVTHCSNVSGAVTEVPPLVAAARAVGARVLLDGAQQVPHSPVDVQALEVDFYAFSGHKMFAPNGIGVLWGRRELLDAMEPLMGGGQMIRSVTWERTVYLDPPRRFEAGTPPIAQAVGLGAACRWLGGIDREAARAHARRLAGRVLDGLAAIPGARVIGPSELEARAPLISFTLAGLRVAEICRRLDERHGVAVRGGHHCAMPLMAALGLPDGTARASLAFYNDDADVDALLAGLADAATRAA